MKTLAQYINEWKVSGSTVSSVNKRQIIIVNDYDELTKIVRQRYEQDPEILDFSDLDVSNITNFNKINTYEYYGLFANLEHTRIINVIGWNTKQVTDMSNTFWGCINLEEVIGLKTWDFSSVKATSWMFFNCWKLEKANGIEHLKSFNANNIITQGMFEGCIKLKKPKWYIGTK